MKNKYIFKSSLASHIEGLINQKRADGFKYEFEAYILKIFDDFCIKKCFSDTVITRELAME